MSLTLIAQPAYSSNHCSQLGSSTISSSHSSGNMTSALPSLFMKHTRSQSLEKQASTSSASSGPSNLQLQSIKNGSNGHSSSTSNDHVSSGSSVASTSSNPASNSFICNGDIVYESGPPVPAPVPSVGTRSYTVLKEVGDGSFGTVWLADWHSPLALPKGTGPPGPSSRPEYKGKRLVALKRMKKAFEGGWDECMKLKELKSLRSISMHPNIIPLYDAFLLPSSKELYFVFECMEGNLYQLTRSRKGRPLAAGLVADLFHQILAGLDHIHSSGYFHRDMKPENLLITTTGLADYPCYTAPQHLNDSRYTNRPPEKDVVAIVKIADFGLARETRSRPPYTEYVSTRWYRAPEVLLRSRDYSNPVDMWAVGTILAEMVTLKPLFPGQSEVDQVYRICEVMGDPSNDYGVDGRGRLRGGGPWERGIKMAKQVGFSFPKIAPVQFVGLFETSQVPYQLVDIMADLMRYDPKARLTTQQCLDHPYFSNIAIHLKATLVPSIPNHASRPQPQSQSTPKVQIIAIGNPDQEYALPRPDTLPPPRDLPPSHSHTSQSTRPPFELQQQATGLPGLPLPSTSSTHSPYSASEYDSPSALQSRDRHISIANSLMSNDSNGFGGMQVHLGGSTTSNMSSPGMGYPESVLDVSMEGDDLQHHKEEPSPVPSSIYSFGQGPSESMPQSNIPHHQVQSHHHHLPQPLASGLQNNLRQGANGYASSVHSNSYFDPSLSSDGLGRRGSAGGASTFYDGSIFEGIAPTRAASILSFPASHGTRPPSPKFSQSAAYASAHNLHLQNVRRRNDADNISVDFEREALQRSQNAGTSAMSGGVLSNSDSQENLKGGKSKDGKRGWMSSVFNSSSSNQNVPQSYHPQQQPLIHPANFPASSSASIYSSHHDVEKTSLSGSSLKRTPSERSMHAPELPPTQPNLPLDSKKAKKEAERLAKEAEKAKRDVAQKAARDRARAVMQKRNALAQAADPLHNFGQHQFPGTATKNQQLQQDKDKQRALLEAAARKQQALINGKLPQIAEDGRLRGDVHQYNGKQQYPDVRHKARRLDDDDDVHSMSSNETRSERRFSISSHTTVSTVSTTHTMDSDPGPSRSNRGAVTGLLSTVHRSPSLSSFGGHSHLSVGSQNSGQSRRDLGTSGSGSSSLEYGLVGRFQGLTAAETDQASIRSTGGSPSPASSSHPVQLEGSSPYYNHSTPHFSSHNGQFSPRTAPSHSSPSLLNHQQHTITLPSIRSFDHPPPKDFSFGTVPRTSHSQNSNNSTISGNSGFITQGLPFTPEMYQHHLQQQQRGQEQ